MPSMAAMTIMAGMGLGATAGGYGAHRYAQRREDMDTSDRLGFTAMSGLAAGAAGGAIAYAGPFRVAGAGFKGANFARKALFSNPGKSWINKSSSMGARAIRSMGIGQGFGAFKNVGKGIKYGGVMAAAIGLAVGAVAMSSGGDYQRSDRAEGTVGVGMTTREKLGVMGATGDMVFGLNNSRHG